MAQILRIRAINPLGVTKFQLLSRFLHKIHQFVDLQQRHEGVHDCRKIASHQNEQCRPADGQSGSFLGMDHFFGRRCAFRFEEENLHIRQILKGFFDFRPNIRPA